MRSSDTGATPSRRQVLARQALRFGATGLVNTGISYVVFNVVLRLAADAPRPALVAQAASYVVGMATSFALNSRWTFRDRQAPRGAAARFVVLQVAVLAATSGAISWLVDTCGAHAQLTWLGVTAIATVVNFAGQRLWVFPAGARTGTGGPGRDRG